MQTDLSNVKFFAKATGDHWPKTMEELVEGWIALNNAREDEPAYRSLSWAFDAASDLCYGYPELAFEFVLAVLAKHISEETFFVLAAGPLEDLLANNGAAIIDRVEVQARLDTRFQELLGGVWRNKMSEDIWQRVQRAASPAC